MSSAEEAIALGVIAGLVVTTLLALSACIGACVVGFGFRIGQNRNLMPAAMRVAVYLSGYLAVWGMLSVLLGLAVTAARPLFSRFIDYEVIQFLVWVAANLVLFVGFIWLVARGTAGARYANH